MNNDSAPHQRLIYASLNQVEIGGQRFRLRPRTMDVLVYLAERPDRVVTAEDLLRDVWRGVVVSDNSVYRAISELRQSFADAGEDSLIETIPKRGYRLASGFIFGAGEALPARADNEARISRAWRFRRPVVWLTTVSIVVAAGLFMLQTTWNRSSDTGQPIIGVLPFTDLSPGADQQYLADGVSVQIRNEIGRIDGIRVAGSSSMAYFRNRYESVEAIGEKLDVRFVLDGTISRDGDDLRWTVELIDTDTGLLSWSRIYDSKFENVLDVQNDIALSVAEAVGIRLGVSQWSPYPGMTRNVAAYEEYLLASNVPGNSGEDIRTAIAHLERAVSIDPEFGVAWVTLATIYTGLELGIFDSQVPSTRERAQHAIQKARELNPGSPLVLEHLGLVASIEGRWSEAESHYDAARRATEKYSSGQFANVFYAEFLIRVGRISDAISHLEQARNVNRLDLDVALMLALAYGCAGDLEMARAELIRSATLEPSPRASALMSGFMLIALGSQNPAMISRFWGDPPDPTEVIDPMNINRWAKSYYDDPDGALEMLHRHAPLLIESDPIPLATWANFYGDPELGLRAYRSTQSEVQIALGMHLWVPLYADMRALPGFKELAQELGLADYWRESGHWSDFCSPVSDLDFECS
jgi:TolB-like protein/DNA-binding winged helix-turn-helix (wHTH) protein/Flp pilus assembly protein TadD